MTTGNVGEFDGVIFSALRLNLFGAFELEVRGVPTATLSRAARSVLALLALRSSQLVERDYLAATLWPDSDDAAARYNLRRTLMQMRSALGVEAARLEAPTTQTLRLDLSGGAFCDVTMFDAALRSGLEPVLQEALQLYATRGALFPGERGEWIVPEREARREAYLAAREKLAARHAERTEPGEAIRHLREILAVDPLRETAVRDLMRRLSESGQGAAALSAYRSLAEQLRTDAESSPDATTTALYERLSADSQDQSRGLSLADPATVQAPRGLPRPLATLIGRERDRIEIASYLHGDKHQSSSRLVTLTGAGGVGKTQLAIAAAESVLADYADGTRFVDLAPLVDPKQILSLFAAALRIQDVGPLAGGTLLDRVFDTLRPLHLLLIIDNCEHVVADAAGLALTLLRQCPRLTILATSREPLHVPGEVAWRVPGLEQDAASRLFVERAMQASPTIRSLTVNDPAVRNIAARLDGIPLAIEMAAARVRVMSVEQISARLGNVFKVLTVPGGDLLPRHRTLRATLDWSYDLLSEAERKLLARLSVFAGGWTIDAAEAVGARDGDVGRDDVLDLLASLVEKSLVQYLPAQENVADRYGMLETIRQYGAEKLTESGEADGARDCHRDWYMALAEEANPHLIEAEAQAWNARLEAEHDNFRAALAWCAMSAEGNLADERVLAASMAGLRLSAAIWRFWLVRGYSSEGRTQLHRALAGWRAYSATEGPKKDLARGETGTTIPEDAVHAWKVAVAGALSAESILANAQGDMAAAKPLIEECLSLCREIDYRNGIAASLAILGTTAQYQGDFEAARVMHEESLQLYRELDDIWPVAASLNNLGTAAQSQGDYPAAKNFHEESLAIRRTLGDAIVVADSLNNLGIIAYRQGNYPEARKYYEESVSIQRQLGNKGGIGSALNNLALIVMDEGDYVNSRLLLEESVKIARETGHQMSVGNGLDNLGNISVHEGNLSLAASFYEESLQVRRETADKLGIAASLGNIGEVAAMRGDHATARSRSLESLAICQEIGDKAGAAMAQVNLGNLAMTQDDLDTARTLYEEGLSLYARMERKEGIANVLGRLAQVALREAAPTRAVRLWASAAALRAEIGLSQPPSERAEDDRLLAEAHTALGDDEFASAWDAGRAAGWEGAVGEALSKGRHFPAH